MQNNTLIAVDRAKTVVESAVALPPGKINTLRGLLRGLRCVIPVGAEKVVQQTWRHSEDAESGFPEALRHTFARLCEEIRTLGTSIRDVEQQLRALTCESPVTQRLES